MNATESWKIQNRQKNADHHQDLVTPFFGHAQPLQNISKSVHNFVSYLAYNQKDPKANLFGGGKKQLACFRLNVHAIKVSVFYLIRPT